jgi:hypothetical protein
MRLFPRSVAAAILAAGCYLSIPTVNVLAQSPPGPSTSAPDLSDQKLSAVAAALERVASPTGLPATHRRNGSIR